MVKKRQEENPIDLTVRCRIIRSGRRTLAMEMRGNELLVRAPRRVSDAEIRAFLSQHQSWIKKQLAKAARQQEAEKGVTPLTEDELTALTKEARQHITERVQFYAPLVGVTYGRISIRRQRSRWGSCSSKGNLNFNCLLMLAPPEVLDSVIVHELCHRRFMNHSAKFYAEVLRVFPDYRTCERWLKENGALLMKRLPAAPP